MDETAKTASIERREPDGSVRVDSDSQFTNRELSLLGLRLPLGFPTSFPSPTPDTISIEVHTA